MALTSCEIRLNLYPADHNYCRFSTVLLVNHITIMSEHQDLQIYVVKLNKYK